MDVLIRIGLEVIGWAGLAQGAITWVQFYLISDSKWADEAPRNRDVEGIVLHCTFALAGVIILTSIYIIAA